MNRRDYIVGACAAKNPIRTVVPRAPGGSAKTEFDGDTLVVWRRAEGESGAASAKRPLISYPVTLKDGVVRVTSA